MKDPPGMEGSIHSPTKVICYVCLFVLSIYVPYALSKNQRKLYMSFETIKPISIKIFIIS